MKAGSAVSAFFHCCYIFVQTGTQRISTMLTTVWLTESLEKTLKEGEAAPHLITQHNSPDTFTIRRSPDCNGVLCLQRGHSGTSLLLLIIVVHCCAIKKPSTDSQLITYSVI